MGEETDSDTLLRCFIGERSKHMRGRAGNHTAHKHIHVHTILGTPPVPSPLTPRPLAPFPVPCLPHWEPLPLFWTNFTFWSSLDSEPVSTAPLYSNLPHLNRQGLIAQCTHTHPDKDKEAHCDTQAPDRNTLKAAWSFKWPSGYSTLLHFTSISFKAVSAKCLGRVRAYRLAGSRFTLGESNRLKNHKVL